MQHSLSISLRDVIAAAVLGTFAFAFCPNIQGQNPPPTPRSVDDVVRTNTELVQTEIMVFDRKGNFVDSLRPEQFRLSLDGKERPISLISRITAGSTSEAAQLAAARMGAAPPTTSVSNSTPLSRPGRLIFFFVDDIHLSPESLGRARKALLRFVDHQMATDDQVAVVSTSGQVGFLQQLTDNRLVLHTAIGRLGDKRTREGYVGRTKITEYMASRIQDSRDSKLFTYLMESVKVEYALGGGSRRAGGNNDSAGQAYRILRNRVGNVAAQSKADTAATLSVLRNLMQISARLPGRKLVFFLSDGFIVDPRSSNAFDVLQQVTQAAAQSGAVIYTMDTRGTFTDPEVDASFGGYVDMTSRKGGVSLGETIVPREPLSVLAEETGGRAIFNSSSIDEAIKQAVRETSDYYVLAWRPDAENERRGATRINVSIEGRPELRVRLRRIYFRPPKKETNEAVKDQPSSPLKTTPETELLSALGSHYPAAALPTSLSVGFVQNAEGVTLHTSMQVDRGVFNFNPGTEGQKAEVDVIGAAVDDRGQIYSFKHVLTVIPQTSQESSETPVVWNQQLKVQPGLYQVRVAVRDRQTGRTGSAMQWIEVPVLEQNRLAMSSLFLGERRAGSSSANNQGPQPIRVDVDHRFPRTSVLRFQTYVYNASRPGGAPDVWIQAKVLRGTQQVAAVAPNRIPPDVSTDPTRLPYWTEISLAQLPAGRYTLEVSATDRAANSNASQTISFSVD